MPVPIMAKAPGSGTAVPPLLLPPPESLGGRVIAVAEVAVTRSEAEIMAT